MTGGLTAMTVLLMLTVPVAFVALAINTVFKVQSRTCSACGRFYGSLPDYREHTATCGKAVEEKVRHIRAA